jgi:hypothetical protein
MTTAAHPTQGAEYPDFTVIKLEEFLENKEKAKETPPAEQTVEAKTTLLGKLIPGGLIVMDNLLDLVPIGSAASNAINLGLKHIVFRGVDPESSFFKDYIKHLNEKQTKTCLAYSLPLAGNVLKLGVLATKAVIAVGTLDDRFVHQEINQEASKEESHSEELAKVTI